MRDNGIHARQKRRYKVTTDSKHGLSVAENLLARNFTPAAPNQVWTSDADMKATSFGYIEVCHNRKRQHSTLGYKSPMEFLDHWVNEQHQEKRIA